MKTLRVLFALALLSLSGAFLLADSVATEAIAEGIVNKAVIGETSHVSGDASGNVRNATGTAASLVEPTKLLPRAPRARSPPKHPDVKDTAV